MSPRSNVYVTSDLKLLSVLIASTAHQTHTHVENSSLPAASPRKDNNVPHTHRHPGAMWAPQCSAVRVHMSTVPLVLVQVLAMTMVASSALHHEDPAFHPQLADATRNSGYVETVPVRSPRQGAPRAPTWSAFPAAADATQVMATGAGFLLLTPTTVYATGHTTAAQYLQA